MYNTYSLAIIKFLVLFNQLRLLIFVIFNCDKNEVKSVNNNV